VLAGYYDAEGLSGFEGWDRAARGIMGVDGFMVIAHRLGTPALALLALQQA
jgi:hypothetical protein